MFKKRFQLLIGNQDEFSMEHRMFHAVSIVISVTLFAEAIFYAFTTLTDAVYACFISGIAQLGLFYLSRFKNRFNLAFFLCAGSMNLMHILTYMVNGGISGNMLLLSGATLFLSILVVSGKNKFIWLGFNLFVVFLMMGLEYFDPGIVKQHYISRAEQFLDIAVSYVTMTIVSFAGILILHKNYTIQKQRADQQAERLQEMNDEKDKLFSIIAHDMNAPMASLKQYLALMRAAELDVMERSMIEKKLTHSLGDAQNLLNNLLLWAKSQMQHKHCESKPLAVKGLLMDAVRLYQPQATLKGIHVHVDLEEDLHVLADENMLMVVMRNLINNAVKFTHLEGEVELKSEVRGESCIISIKDNGIGIMPEKQRKIFSLNVLSSYGTANEKGTGLGLMLCKEYVELQGGKIWFESIPWEGTTFYVSLPMVAVDLSPVATLSLSEPLHA